ncbi:MAG: poly-gamma-glutamate system protein [Clostridia bacterium]|nr:poly-gamma-glutamate system protein [Clostridia bacterium]
MTKRAKTALVLCLWLLFVILSVALCDATKTLSDSPHQAVMLKATALAQRAFDEIKYYKQRHNIAFSDEDLLQTGLLGQEFSYIVTTDGVLKSKRTSVNPHWAAVVVSMFVKAKLQPGDQVLMVFSGSFPALNVCAVAAGEAYGLDMCLMGSVGASNFGATNEDFTFFDMMAYLCGYGAEQPRQKVFDKQSMLDCVSLGGGNDCGSTFGSYMIWDDNASQTAETYRNQIKQRIEAVPSVTFVEQSNFQQNIAYRLEYLQANAADVKFMLNVGGSMVGLGIGLSAHIESGYVSPGIVVNNGALVNVDPNDGLLQRYLQRGIPVASLLNMQGMAEQYGIPYDPGQLPSPTDMGQSNVYFTTKYNFVIPVVALIVTLLVAVLFCVLRVKNKIEVKQNERNHILCRR